VTGRTVQDPFAQIKGFSSRGGIRSGESPVQLVTEMRDCLVDKRLEGCDTGGGVVLGDRPFLRRVLVFIVLAEDTVHNVAVDEGAGGIVVPGLHIGRV